jgi:hypothetical protein
LYLAMFSFVLGCRILSVQRSITLSLPRPLAATHGRGMDVLAARP